MTDHKFTDEEVIKALECCRDFGDCSLCPYDGAVFDDEPDCVEKLHTYAIDLINRQKAEIERMEQRIMMLNEICNSYALQYGTAIDKEIILKQAKAEAVKEFAERLKQTAYTHSTITGYQYPIVDVSEIDNLVKEMTEEKKQ